MGLPVGRLLSRRSLGTEAVYRVVCYTDARVQVEVVEAPRLNPGARLTLTRGAAQAICNLGGAHSHERLKSAAPCGGGERRRGQDRRRLDS